MAFEVRALNTKDCFGDSRTAMPMFAAIMRHAPDLAVFSEAYSAQAADSNALSSTVDRFRSEGYAVTHGLYKDSDGRADSHGIMVISRLGGRGKLVGMDSRNAVQLEGLADPATARRFDFIGAHLDDRHASTRNSQLRTLLKRVVNPVRPTIIAGDLNASHGDDRAAPLIRAGGSIIHKFGTIEPADYHALSGPAKAAKLHRRIGSIGQRAHGMIDDGTMRRLAYAGFRDADPNHRPTMSVGGLALQIDHIMVSREFNHTVPHRPAKIKHTDHRMAGATVAFFPQAAKSK